MKKRKYKTKHGFALIATISILSLVVIIAIGMLSLATTTSNTLQHTKHLEIAQANAKLALAEAISQLQLHLGKDQSICADATLFDSVPGTIAIEGVQHPHLLGVWSSWSPNFTAAPQQTAPNYVDEKASRFKKWLISHPDSNETARFDYAITGTPSSESPAPNTITLYNESSSGFHLQAPLVNIDTGGSYAWHIAQEGSKAKINAASSFVQHTNDQLVAPSQTSYSINPALNQISIEDDGDKFLSFSQMDLSPDLQSSTYQRALIFPHFTTSSKGLLVDVVNGGLKKDLSLAFELNDTEFNAEFNTDLASYAPELPLFTPIITNGVAEIDDPYGALNYTHQFKSTATPTFQTLRSHYLLYKKLYTSNDQLTVFQREKSHIAWPTANGLNDGIKTETGVVPVLNRFMLLNRMGLDPSGLPQYVLTPLVSMWNPYNVAVETEGFEITPSLDYPIELQWKAVQTTSNQNGTTTSFDRWRQTSWLSVFLGDGSTFEGRQVNPYFYLYLTENGSFTGTPSPIRFEPGEIKVFSLTDTAPRIFNRTGTKAEKTFHMKPVESLNDFNIQGGIQIAMDTAIPNHDFNNVTDRVLPGEKYGVISRFNTSGAFRSGISVQDLGDRHGRAQTTLSIIQMFGGSGLDEGDQEVNSIVADGDDARINGELTLLCIQETFLRTARTSTSGNESSDMFYSVNPRQTIMSRLISGTPTPQFPIAPNVMIIQRAANDFASTGFQTNTQGSRSFYGESNAPSTGGRTQVIAFEIPVTAPMNIASLQHADVSNSVFNPAMQIGNSYSSPYLPIDSVATIQAIAEGNKPINPSGTPLYDTSYLCNEALWDSYYFSSAAPEGTAGAASGSFTNLRQGNFEESAPLEDVLEQFIENPSSRSLRNKRMLLSPNDEQNLLANLLSPSGYKTFAAHLSVDGMFNVNSTSKEAWKAFLASTRDLNILESNSAPMVSTTPLVRMHQPTGSANDPWDGYRLLSDSQIDSLAEQIVVEVKTRGPFLSLAEFVNRRIEDSDLGTRGVIQAAIDRSSLNSSFDYADVDSSRYPFPDSYAESKTGVGTPGYLMQTDVLSSIGTSINVRSDTFTIRAYGDSYDANNNVKATAYCEALVQRQHSFVDPSQPSTAATADLNTFNATYGRKFKIVQFKWISINEIQ